jgi:glycosyltransferase involved in cell wall biosynthesis
MAKDRNLVSVCMPTFNGEAYIKEALASVKAQTYRPLELICSDDQSTDGTVKILEKFKDEVDFPVYIYRHRSSGIGANWNNCLKKANGEYVKFLFQDDVLKPLCLEKMIIELSGQEEIALITSKRYLIYKAHEKQKYFNWIKEYGDLQKKIENDQRKRILLDKRFFASKIFRSHPINKIAEPSGIFFRKELINNIGYFREDMNQILDVEFYNRILKKYKILILPEKLYGFRLHAQQTSARNEGKNENDFELYDRLLLKNYFWYLDISVRLQLLDKFWPLMARIYRYIRSYNK